MGAKSYVVPAFGPTVSKQTLPRPAFGLAGSGGAAAAAFVDALAVAAAVVSLAALPDGAGLDGRQASGGTHRGVPVAALSNPAVDAAALDGPAALGAVSLGGAAIIVPLLPAPSSHAVFKGACIGA